MELAGHDLHTCWLYPWNSTSGWGCCSLWASMDRILLCTSLRVLNHVRLWGQIPTIIKMDTFQKSQLFMAMSNQVDDLKHVVQLSPSMPNMSETLRLKLSALSNKKKIVKSWHQGDSTWIPIRNHQHLSSAILSKQEAKCYSSWIARERLTNNLYTLYKFIKFERAALAQVAILKAKGHR